MSAATPRWMRERLVLRVALTAAEARIPRDKHGRVLRAADWDESAHAWLALWQHRRDKDPDPEVRAGAARAIRAYLARMPQ